MVEFDDSDGNGTPGGGDSEEESILVPYGEHTYRYHRRHPCDICRSRADGVRIRRTMSGIYSYPLCDDCYQNDPREGGSGRFIRWETE